MESERAEASKNTALNSLPAAGSLQFSTAGCCCQGERSSQSQPSTFPWKDEIPKNNNLSEEPWLFDLAHFQRLGTNKLPMNCGDFVVWVFFFPLRSDFHVSSVVGVGRGGRNAHLSSQVDQGEDNNK